MLRYEGMAELSLQLHHVTTKALGPVARAISAGGHSSRQGLVTEGMPCGHTGHGVVDDAGRRHNDAQVVVGGAGGGGGR